MSNELLINVTGGEVRAALVEDDTLVDLIIAREERESLIGNIYMGHIAKLVSGINAAFVDIGTGRSGFLPLAVAGEAGEEGDAVDHLDEGEMVCVQVIRDAIGRKGPQLSRQLSLPGRHLVYTPERDRIAVSRLIEDEDERERLIRLVEGLAAPGEGFILRTAAEGADEAALMADAEQLRTLWDGVAASRAGAHGAGLLHADLGPVPRILRDYAGGGELDAIRIDSQTALAEARTFCERFIPEAVRRLAEHHGPAPLFDMFDIEAAIERALGSHLGLPSGAGIVIEATEALTAIDVNSGGFTGGSGPEENALRTNLEAAAEIARQIRLRNIGGLIVIDFIQMEEEENWERVLDTLDAGLARDRLPNRIVGHTPSGLVEVTRRRRRESLAQTLTAPCDGCTGTGRIKTAETVGFEVLRALRREAGRQTGGALVVTAGGGIIDHLETAGKGGLAAVADALGRRVTLRAEPGYGREHFDIMVE